MAASLRTHYGGRNLCVGARQGCRDQLYEYRATATRSLQYQRQFGLPWVTRAALSDANLQVHTQQEGVTLEEMERRRSEVIPLRRANDPETAPPWWSSSPRQAARNLTGQSFNVDGGLIPD